jgi:hypothetical protein
LLRRFLPEQGSKLRLQRGGSGVRFERSDFGFACARKRLQIFPMANSRIAGKINVIETAMRIL